MRDKIVFVITTWFFSRSVVILGMQFIAPMLHISPLVGHPLPLDYVSGFVARSGWELFTHWDGAWYRKVAVFGYDYADDGQKHSIAFFPLFPLICRGFMSFGLPFDVAGPLTNNLSFLGALFLLYNWAEERYGVQVARWATSVLAWCPFSLFGTVAYTEGLFLFCTVGTLRSFDNCQYFRAAVWGALATATRSIGVVLIPAFLIVALEGTKTTYRLCYYLCCKWRVIVVYRLLYYSVCRSSSIRSRTGRVAPIQLERLDRYNCSRFRFW